MELEQQISEACGISLDEARNCLHYERQSLMSLMDSDSLDYEAVEEACFALGVEPDLDNIALLLLC